MKASFQNLPPFARSQRSSPYKYTTTMVPSTARMLSSSPTNPCSRTPCSVRPLNPVRNPMACAAGRRLERLREDEDEWRQRKGLRGSPTTTKGGRRRDRGEGGADAEHGDSRSARGRPTAAAISAVELSDRELQEPSSSGLGRGSGDGQESLREEEEEAREEEGEDEDDEAGPRSAEDGFFDGKSYRLVSTESGENTILINGERTGVDAWAVSGCVERERFTQHAAAMELWRVASVGRGFMWPCGTCASGQWSSGSILPVTAGPGSAMPQPYTLPRHSRPCPRAAAGVKMHISMSKRPSQDAEDKCKLIKVRKGSTVLDICCGEGCGRPAGCRGLPRVQWVQLVGRGRVRPPTEPLLPQ